jgi:1-acyl-sn-glycerol-3-phosphate acyltransferase
MMPRANFGSFFRSDQLLQLFCGINRLYCRVYHDVTVETPLHLPRTGPAVLVCNHISGLDPLLLQAASRRVIVWMMAREYFEIRALNWFFKLIRAIPVDRNGRDTSATRAALRALKDGSVIGIFPEGRIAPTRELLPFQTGVSLLAARAEAPIVPAYIDGTNRGQEMAEAFSTANRVRLRFGEPFHVPTGPNGKPDLDISTERIRKEVASLRHGMLCS